LADDFIEALGVDLFTDSADTAVSRFQLSDALFQVSCQVRHVKGGGWGRRNVANPELAVIVDLLWGQNLVQVVFGALLLRLHWGQLLLLFATVGLCLVVG
jgi:hypothetical protein